MDTLDLIDACVDKANKKIDMACLTLNAYRIRIKRVTKGNLDEDPCIELYHGFHVQITLDGNYTLVQQIGQKFKFFDERTTLAGLVKQIQEAQRGMA